MFFFFTDTDLIASQALRNEPENACGKVPNTAQINRLFSDIGDYLAYQLK